MARVLGIRYARYCTSAAGYVKPGDISRLGGVDLDEPEDSGRSGLISGSEPPCRSGDGDKEDADSSDADGN